MNSKLILKTSFILTVFAFFAYINVSHAFLEECDEDGFITGTKCPCFPEAGTVSVCGYVGGAGIEKELRDDTEKDIYSTFRPRAGVTVTIYENNPAFPGTVGPFGDFDTQYGYCATNAQGAYACEMRQINPGFNVWVFFSCDGTVKAIRNISSIKSVINLDQDVDCLDPITPTPLPTTLSITDRNKFLGCTFEEDALDVGFGSPEAIAADPAISEQYEYRPNTVVGETNYDSRYSKNAGVSIFGITVGDHPGSYWPDDCVWIYGDGPDDQQAAYRCDLNNAMAHYDEITSPYLDGLPEFLVQKAYRPFEVRSEHQREVMDYKLPARTNHLLSGDCIGGVLKRYFGQEAPQQHISCDEIKKCADTMSDPYRNTHTAYSIVSRTASPLTWLNLLKQPERDPNDVICTDAELGDVTIAQIQPAFAWLRQSSCEPGTAGCMYKLSSEYFLPLFLAGSGKKPYTTETWNDVPGKQGYRAEPWLPAETEAEATHWVGELVVHNQGFEKNNSVQTMTRLVTNTLTSDTEILGNRIMSPADVNDPDFEVPTNTTIWDVGADLQSLCTLSSANGTLTSVTIEQEDPETLVLNNNFQGSAEEHRSDKGAVTAAFGPEVAFERQRILNDDSWTLFGLTMLVRDMFDTALIYTSGGTYQDFSIAGLIGNLISAILDRGDDNVFKSFAQRVGLDEVTLVGPYNEELTVSYPLARENYPVVFPAFAGLGVNNGYPGDAGDVYPWVDIANGDYCDVHPGPGNDPLNQIRSCKVTQCQVWSKKSKCAEYNDEGECIDWKIVENKTPCNEANVTQCLTDQKDTWEDEPPTPGNDNENEVVDCNLERAGPLQPPSALDREQASVIKQEPYSGFQADARNIVKVTNHMNCSFSSPADGCPDLPAMSFLDLQTTNNLDGAGIASRTAAGIPSYALGTGATTELMKKVMHPERTMVNTAEFIPFVQTCNTPNCAPIDPPPPIYLEDLPDGGSCTPSAGGGGCPISVSPEMEIVMGAAGAYSNVPGSLILAAMWPEGAFGGGFPLDDVTFAHKWDWTPKDVEDWSVNWYDMMPYCNPSIWTAEGPFGLITNWFNIAVEQGGYHPTRIGTNVWTGEQVVVVQKCNLIDAAYAAAKMLQNNSNGSCTDWDSNEAFEKLKVYRGGTDPTDTQMAIFNQCR